MTVAGMPAEEARTWMRKFAGHSYDIERVPADARAAFDQLAAGGFVTRTHDEYGTRYEVTIEGGALASARFGKPIKRSTAERALTDLVARAEKINQDPDLVVWVDKVAVFGSYLDPGIELLGDVDCVAWYSARIDDHEQFIAASVERANRTRRNLSIAEFYGYGYLEVRTLLKGNSHTISLHNPSDGVFELVEPQVVYDRLSGN